MLGVILNRPLDVKLSTIWDQISELPCKIDPVAPPGRPL